MGIIKYILYSRYRPLNLIETIFVSFLNLFYIKKYKQISFHIFRQKRKPAATVYYNNLGRIILYLVNIFFIIIFNKFLLRNIFFSRNFNNVISREKKNGDDFSHWPRISISKQCISSNNKLDEEIEHKCNIQLNLLSCSSVNYTIHLRTINNPCNDDPLVPVLPKLEHPQLQESLI